MARFEKSTREVLDVDEEIKKFSQKDKKKKKLDSSNAKDAIVTEKGSKKEKSSKKADDQKNKSKGKNKKEKKEHKGPFHFFKEVKKEVSLVKWPSKKEMIKYSVATIAFVLFFSLYFYLIQVIVALVKTWV